ncbi:copper amine oxidase N-terminal domain-containing protein [Paenibacillus sp. 1011MAR3C5]|uniref:copper amine oxidase N-terminal domain-containing protein n=1 Tax=Paenibacillus sp. 1011MAR3C5 TaxID=1675787 RepID=UPI000E6BF050|nr:copper amine oxidase N-terminal domain-containing protein [Paenibacillus sp. 1011MAR3C5]RJE88919.1 copper amine oxidase N-terminal domain-containing protein [Paenibacillus sp. 1011MAR3C5]
MRKWLKAKRLSMLLLAMTILIAAGCQSVGGLDLNQTLKNSLKTTSSESKSTIEFKLNLDEKAIEAAIENEEATVEDAELIRLFSNVKLELHQLQADHTRMSVDGKLTLGEAEPVSVGFSAKADEKTLVIELEGAKQPFMFDLTGETYLEMNGIESEEAALPEGAEESLTKLGFDMMDLISHYGITNLPNPKDLKVAPVSEPINGVETGLMHVQFSLDSKGLWDWAGSYLDALIADRQGLQALVKGILELFESNKALLESMGESELFGTSALDAPTLEEQAEEAASEIEDALVSLRDEMKYMETEDKESLDALFGEALKLNVDVYVDSSLHIRKTQYDLSYTPAAAEEEEMALPFTGLSLKLSTEQWDVNGDVKPAAPAATEDAISLEEAEYMQGYDVVKLFENDSFIYDLLKNKLHITQQSYYGFPESFYNPPIVMPGYITMVAVRDVAEDFGAEVSYDPKTRMITVADRGTDTKIQFQSGSDTVVVNGVKEVWPLPATVIEGTTYVPARKLAEVLGATIEWQTFYEDEDKVLVIEREL